VESGIPANQRVGFKTGCSQGIYCRAGGGERAVPGPKSFGGKEKGRAGEQGRGKGGNEKFALRGRPYTKGRGGGDRCARGGGAGPIGEHLWWQQNPQFLGKKTRPAFGPAAGDLRGLGDFYIDPEGRGRGGRLGDRAFTASQPHLYPARANLAGGPLIFHCVQAFRGGPLPPQVWRRRRAGMEKVGGRDNPPKLWGSRGSSAGSTELGAGVAWGQTLCIRI